MAAAGARDSAPVTTPLKRSASSGNLLTPYAKRLPKTPRTGSKLVQQKVDADHLKLQGIISDCQQDSGNIEVAAAAILERKQALAEEEVLCNAEALGAAKTLAALDDNEKMNAIVKHTTLPLGIVQELYRADGGKASVDYIMEFLTQLHAGRKLPVELRAVPVCRRFFEKRIRECGRAEFVTIGIIVGGKLDRTKLQCFTMKFDKHGCLATMKHIGGDEHPMPCKWLVKGQFSVMDPHLDASAAVKLQGCTSKSKPIKICDMWNLPEEQQTGPFRVQQFVGPKSAEHLCAYVKTIHDTWKQESMAQDDETQATVTQTATAVSEVKRGLAKAKATKGRSAAARKLKETQESRVIEIK